MRLDELQSLQRRLICCFCTRHCYSIQQKEWWKSVEILFCVLVRLSGDNFGSGHVTSDSSRIFFVVWCSSPFFFPNCCQSFLLFHPIARLVPSDPLLYYLPGWPQLLACDGWQSRWISVIILLWQDQGDSLSAQWSIFSLSAKKTQRRADSDSLWTTEGACLGRSWNCLVTTNWIFPALLECGHKGSSILYISRRLFDRFVSSPVSQISISNIGNKGIHRFRIHHLWVCGWGW